ncbi:MAG TPA: hypothetical protein VNB64_12195 [Solirubrobacteraceae bacterium]|nr:hypothetical protein [Solirubrobacteraceae bacterium]
MTYHLKTTTDLERALGEERIRFRRARRHLAELEVLERAVRLALVVLLAVLAVAGIFVRPDGMEAGIAIVVAAAAIAGILRFYRPGR